MGLFSRLFGSRPQSEVPEAPTGVALAWANAYELRVPGGPEHQRDREKLFNEFTSGGSEALIVVNLVREGGDAVSIQSRSGQKSVTLGYLDQAEAAEFRRWMRATGKGDEMVGVCMAMIANDGFNPDERYVLLLDLKWPIEELDT